MAKGNTWINDLLKLLFNATAVANIADNAGSSPLTSLYLSLHTADPGAGGNQTSSEVSYTGYARVAVARTSGGFTVSGQSVTLAALTSFGACTAGSATATHWAVGTASSGAGKVLYSGAIGSNQGECTALASNDTFTAPAESGVANGDQVSFYAAPGMTLPTGITSGTLYFVINLSGTTFKVSTSSGGSAVDITGDGGGICFKHTPLVITSSPGVTPQLTTGTTITEY